MRFPGFEGEWVARKFGEVATNKSGKYNPTSARSSIKCIELEHLVSESGQLIGYIDGSRSGSIKNIFSKGDVLFGKLRPYLRKYLQAPFDGVCSSEIWVLTGKGVSNDFLYQIVQTDKFIDLANQSSGSKMPRADWSVVEKGTFSFPAITEQQKISRFLSLLDSRIATQNKIIEQLETLMQGLREKVFTQKMRFRNDDGGEFAEWEGKTLGDVAEITMGQSPESNSYNTEGVGMPLIQGNADITNRKSNPRNYTSDPTKICEIGDIILTVRAPVGATAKSYHKACIGRGVCSIKNNSKSTIDFLYQYLLDYEPKWVRLEQGSTFTAISGSDIRSIEIAIPSVEEQTKIANLLSAIDEKIEAEKKISVQYEVLKRYLLQNLFI